MSEVNGKYMKDENNEIFSPITSSESVIMRGGERTLNNLFGIRDYTQQTQSSASQAFYLNHGGVAITNWYLIRIEGTIVPNGIGNNAKALRIVFNDKNSSACYGISTRSVNGTTTNYAYTHSEPNNAYLGDLMIEGNSTPIKISLYREINSSWVTCIADMGVCDSGGAYNWFHYQGQFSYSVNDLNSINTIKLLASYKLSGMLSLEVYFYQ